MYWLVPTGLFRINAIPSAQNYLFRSVLITSIVFNCFRRIFCYLFLHIYIFYRILAFVTFFPDFTILIYSSYANFIFYSHLKMASERSKRRDLLALSFTTKISKKLLINVKIVIKKKNTVTHRRLKTRKIIN